MAARGRTKTASLAQCRRAFSGLPMMDSLTSTDIEELVPLARVRDYCAGSTLFYEDDEPDAVYFIERGAIEIFKSDGTGKKLPLAVLRDGGVVGEMGLLSNEPRTATVRTLGTVRVVYIESGKINEALANGSLAAHRLALSFARVLSQRLALADRKLFELYQDGTHKEDVQEYSDYNQNVLKSW
jgi:CRP-like cAMP-binding protein